MTDHDLRPPTQQRTARAAPQRSAGRWVLGGIALAAALAAGWWMGQRQATQAPAPAKVATPVPAAASAMPAMGQAPTAEDAGTATPALQSDPLQPLHPMALEGEGQIAAEDAAGLEQAVSAWLGRENALQFIALQGLAHHVVATVDNLPRSHAAPRLWPLHPVGGRMVIAQEGDSMVIAATNAARYDALVGFVQSIDPAQAAAVYRKVYPALQHAYEQLGYPGQHFNDRLVQVIDHLLQTPVVSGPLSVKLVQVQVPGQAPAAPQQPWLRYELVDPQLQALSAGQRILLRIGPQHARTVQAQLRNLRGELTRAPAPASP